MARLTDKENIRKENIVVGTLFEHKGEESAITAQELADILKRNGFNIQKRSLNNMITKIKLERRIPICYMRSKGYFWATKKSEILATVRDLRLMIASLEEHAQFLESFIME